MHKKREEKQHQGEYNKEKSTMGIEKREEQMKKMNKEKRN